MAAAVAFRRLAKTLSGLGNGARGVGRRLSSSPSAGFRCRRPAQIGSQTPTMMAIQKAR
jgi:hypothetical protein